MVRCVKKSFHGQVLIAEDLLGFFDPRYDRAATRWIAAMRLAIVAAFTS
jgi:ketopantoate hydroxymethyltransferase